MFFPIRRIRSYVCAPSTMVEWDLMRWFMRLEQHHNAHSYRESARAMSRTRKFTFIYLLFVYPYTYILKACASSVHQRSSCHNVVVKCFCGRMLVFARVERSVGGGGATTATNFFAWTISMCHENIKFNQKHIKLGTFMCVCVWWIG